MVVELMPLILVGQHSFWGLVRRAANNVPTDSTIVKFVNPANDTIWTKVGRFMTDFYDKTSNAGWVNEGDTIKVIVRDTTGQTARTFCIVTPPGNYIHTLFPAGHAFLVKEVANGAPGDSVNSRIYSKGPVVWSDTLLGRFRKGYWSDDIYFNREKFQRKPALYDSLVFEIFEGSYFARTACQYKREFWDADTAPSCTLKLVGVNENLENKVEQPFQLLITPNPTTGLIKFNQEASGLLYDATGKKILSVNSDNLDLRKYPAGIYFYIDDKKKINEKIILAK